MSSNKLFRPPGPDVSLNVAARILGTDRKYVRHLITQGKLEAYQLGERSVRVRRESILDFRDNLLRPCRSGRSG